MLYFAVFGGLSLTQDIEHSELQSFAAEHMILDFFFLAATGIAGFAMSRDYFSYWKDKGLSGKIAFYKSLPIQTNTIVVSRQLSFIIILLFNGVIFFTSLYFANSYLRTTLDYGEYVAFAMSWLGYSMLVGSIYLYWEVGHGEKKYLIFSCLVVVLYMCLPLIMQQFDAPLVLSSIQQVQSTGFMLPVITITLGVIALVAFGKLTMRQLNRRTLL